TPRRSSATSCAVRRPCLASSPISAMKVAPFWSPRSDSERGPVIQTAHTVGRWNSMKLSQFSGVLPVSAALEQVEVAGLTSDSRSVAPGFLFAALPGTKADGAAFAADAARRGAAAVIAARGAVSAGIGIPVIEVDDP